MSTFVLVHGAWHGGWCWHKIVQRLEARGHKAVAPDYPGHGDDKSPIGDLTFDQIVAKMCATIDTQREPVVLVGHSYGGAVITQTGELRAEKVKTLVYLTAFLLADGQSVGEEAQHDKGSELSGNLAVAPDGRTATANPEIIESAFYAQCPDEDIALARKRLVPEALAGFQTKMKTSPERWGRIPRIYIECTRDRAISIEQQRRMHGNLPCSRVFTLDTDHSPFFSMPDELSEILVGL